MKIPNRWSYQCVQVTVGKMTKYSIAIVISSCSDSATLAPELYFPTVSCSQVIIDVGAKIFVLKFSWRIRGCPSIMVFLRHDGMFILYPWLTFSQGESHLDDYIFEAWITLDNPKATLNSLNQFVNPSTLLAHQKGTGLCRPLSLVPLGQSLPR
jgi:hypothetical protein